MISDFLFIERATYHAPHVHLGWWLTIEAAERQNAQQRCGDIQLSSGQPIAP
jgi:hypothetical protein